MNLNIYNFKIIIISLFYHNLVTVTDISFSTLPVYLMLTKLSSWLSYISSLGTILMSYPDLYTKFLLRYRIDVPPGVAL